jgi:hypothetical protein
MQLIDMFRVDRELKGPVGVESDLRRPTEYTRRLYEQLEELEVLENSRPKPSNIR